MVHRRAHADGGEDRGGRARGGPPARSARRRRSPSTRSRARPSRATWWRSPSSAPIKNPGTEAEVTTLPGDGGAATAPARACCPGMSAEVRITAETHKDAVIVPIQAVTVRAGEDRCRTTSAAGGGRHHAHRQEAHGDARQGRLRGGRGQQGPRPPRAHRHRLRHGARDRWRASRRASGWWRARTARCPRSSRTATSPRAGQEGTGRRGRGQARETAA